MTYAKCSGLDAGARLSFSSRSTTGQSRSTQIALASCFGKLASSRSCVTKTVGCASPRIISSRSFGYDESIGRYAPPDFATARNETIISSERSKHTATNESGFTPSFLRVRASWFDRSFSSRYVIFSAPIVSAIASGVRAACCSNI